MLLMLDVAKLLKNSVGCAFAAGFLLKMYALCVPFPLLIFSAHRKIALL